MYDGQTCGNREIQCTNASGVDVLGHHRLAQVLNKRTTRRRGGAVFFTFDHLKLKWVNCEHSNGETRPVILRWTLWVCNWKKTEIRETIKTAQKQYTFANIRARNGRRWGSWRRPGQARCYPTHCWWIRRFLFAFLCKILTRWQEANIDEGYCLILLKSCQNIAKNICPDLFEYIYLLQVYLLQSEA